MKAAGIPFGYHNHEMEFAKVNPGSTEAKLGRRVKGDCIYELFLKNTDPSLVFFEMDVYWAVMGQQDPIEWLKKYPNRIKVLHRRVRDDEFREYIPASLREWNQGLFRGVGGYA